MATAAVKTTMPAPGHVDRSARMDVRLAASQRAEYECAAALRGQNLTQWATSHLDECAKRDIETATTTMLPAKQFDAFVEALEGPLPEAMRELLASEPQWA